MRKQVVVVGAGLGGLSAAIHARLKGHDVLVVEQGSVPGGKAAGFEIEGFKLDPGPSIVILPEIYESLFKSAGRQMSDYLRFTRLSVLSRVIFQGDEPFDLPAERNACLDFVQQRFPDDAANLRALLAKLDRVAPLIEESIFAHSYDRPWQLLDSRLLRFGLSFNVRASFRQVVDKLFKSPILRAFFYGFPSYGGQSYNSSAPGAFLIPYYMLERGVYYPEVGVAAIPAALFRLAVELGVKFEFAAKASGFQRTNQRITSVVLEDRAISCDAVISNLDRMSTGKMLDRNALAKPSYSYFTLHWGLKREFEGLQHHNLFVPQDFADGFNDLYQHRRFPSSPIVYCNATSVTDPSTAPKGMTNLFAVVTSPAVEDSFDWEVQAPRSRQAVLDALHRQGLGWSDDEVVFERVQTPLYFEREHGNFRGSLYGVDESERLFGMFPLSNRDEEIQNLFYCGGSVQPGAGMPMVVLSGKFAADFV